MIKRHLLILQAVTLAFQAILDSDGRLPEDADNISELVRQFAAQTVPDLAYWEIEQMINAPLRNILPLAAQPDEIPLFSFQTRVIFKVDRDKLPKPLTPDQHQATIKQVDEFYDRRKLIGELEKLIFDKISYDGLIVYVTGVGHRGNFSQLQVIIGSAVFPLEAMEDGQTTT